MRAVAAGEQDYFQAMAEARTVSRGSDQGAKEILALRTTGDGAKSRGPFLQDQTGFGLVGLPRLDLRYKASRGGA